MANWTMAPPKPFGEEVERVALEPDPLVRVIAQIRFSPVLRVQDQGFVAGFQEAIRDVYPLAERLKQQQFAPGPQGSLKVSDSSLWRFSELGGDWQVSLSETFVSLDCSDYTNREEFMERLQAVLDAVASHVDPGLSHRIGVRYMNRLAGREQLDQLEEFVRPELLGLGTADLASGELISQLNQAEMLTDGVTLRGRWGRLLPNTTHEGSIEPIDNPSWVLDLDAFSNETAAFSASHSAAEVLRYASIVYCFFRWAMSDEFLMSRGVTT